MGRCSNVLVEHAAGGDGSTNGDRVPTPRVHNGACWATLLLAAMCAHPDVLGAGVHAQSQAAAPVYAYGMQIDAGSSGSRVYVYKWRRREFAGPIHKTSWPITQVGWAKKVKPGISSYVATPSAAGASMTALLEFAKVVLARESVSTPAQLAQVAVFLGATAGMRVLPAPSVALVMASVRTALAGSGLLFKPAWARVLSGEEEGVFGWITANALFGTLNSSSAVAPPPTYGALDMGGASMQITFAPQGDVLANMFPLRINDISQALYTHSFLYFGAHEAAARAQKNLKVNDSKAIDPCLPTGYSSNETVDGMAVTLAGSSDPAGCWKSALALIDKSVPCLHGDRSACSFMGVYQPTLPPQMKFVAMSTFYYTYAFLGLNSTADLTAALGQADVLCSLNYTALKAKADPRQRYLTRQCFLAYYMVALLSSGLGFHKDHTPLVVQKEIKGSDLEWTFGAMLYQCNQLGWVLTTAAPPPGPAASPKAASPKGAWVLASVVAVLAVICAASCFLSAHRKQQKRGLHVDTNGSIYAPVDTESDI